MSEGLMSISPLASYIGSFLDPSFPSWLLLCLATVLHWFGLIIPGVVVIGFIDRKLGPDIQMRIGPNRVPGAGFLQGVADTIKLFFKEDVSIHRNEGLLFRWGTVVAIVAVFSAIGMIPVAQDWALSNVESGVVCVLFAMIFSNLAGFWSAYAARDPWSVVSAFRVLPIIAAYVVPMTLSLISVILIAGSANFEDIVRIQGGLPWRWILFHNPGTLLSGSAFFVALLLWQGRAPFEYARASSEIPSGHEHQYSGARRGLLRFFEDLALLLSLGFMVSTFLGGWNAPFHLESFGRAANLVQWLVFTLKALGLGLLYVWIRWSLPRMRIDQIIHVSWKVLVPMAMSGGIITALWLVLFSGKGLGEFL